MNLKQSGFGLAAFLALVVSQVTGPTMLSRCPIKVTIGLDTFNNELHNEFNIKNT
ncbi:hypothetical protein FD17_GL002192 [Lentilactobacillus sunkii DSM 19904]|uniref:Uncharacterized protein n=1 Tax=Lentilactobacillus sunkii DSM 19904 TaxID=1423808 RepID=A0A0R1L7R2_9LACO|nr:hypothetical protein FD17_GL002192 [Lentilactobacillus sunkii DSM 19904]